MALRIWLPLNGNLENKGISGTAMTGEPASWGDGKIGKCATFTGNTSKIIYNNTTEYNYTDNFSWTVWIKTNYTGTTAQYAFTNGRADAGGYGYGLQCSSTTNCYCRFGNQGYSISVTGGEWTHLAFTKKGTNIKIYKNGTLITDATFSGTIPTYSDGNGLGIGCFHYSSNIYPFYGSLNDFRLYDHCLSTKEVKEISQGLVLHYKLDNPSITNFSEIGNLIPNYKEMALGSANVSTGTWRLAGTSNMTRTRIQITDSPVGTCYCFQNSGIQTANDGSCYGIDSTTYFEPNTEYRISMFARITSGTEGYAGYNIYNISSELGGSHTKIDKNYRVTPLNSDGTWTYCWYHIKTNSSTTRNIYIGITTGETSVTTQMCLVRIEKWNEGMNNSIITDSSGYGNDGEMVGNSTIKTDSKRYKIDTDFSGTSYIANIINPIRLNNEFTISWWGKINSWKKNWEGFFILQNTTALNSASGTYSIATALHASTANLMTLTIRQGGSSYALDKYKWTYEIGTWAYYACTYKAGVVTYYQNGLSIYTETIPDNSSTDYYYHIGRRVQNSDCEISDFRIYATALSAEDILDLYHTPAQIDNLGGVHGFEINEIGTLSLSDLSLTSSNWVSDGVTAIYSEGDVGPMVKITPSSGYKRIYHNVSNVWASGKSYIVSFMAKADANGAVIRASRSLADFSPNFNLTTSWKVYYGIITSTASTSSGTLSIDCQTSTNYYITDVKLEEANKNLISVLKNGIIKENWIDEDNFNNSAKFLKESSVIIGNNFIEK